MVTNQECIECGTEVSKDAKYCPRCGTDLSENLCSNCGVKIEDDPNYCPECGYETHSDTEDVRKSGSDSDKTDEVTANTTNKERRVIEDDPDDSNWEPAFPIFSVFTGLMLIWAGIVQPPGDIFGLFLIVAGILVIPRVRRRVVPLIRKKAGVDLSWHRADWEGGPPDSIWTRPFFLVSMTYTLLLLLAVAVSVMEAVNDPTVSASAGLVMAVFVFFLAVAIVYGIKGIRRATTA